MHPTGIAQHCNIGINPIMHNTILAIPSKIDIIQSIIASNRLIKQHTNDIKILQGDVINAQTVYGRIRHSQGKHILRVMIAKHNCSKNRQILHTSIS